MAVAIAVRASVHQSVFKFLRIPDFWDARRLDGLYISYLDLIISVWCIIYFSCYSLGGRNTFMWRSQSRWADLCINLYTADFRFPGCKAIGRSLQFVFGPTKLGVIRHVTVTFARRSQSRWEDLCINLVSAVIKLSSLCGFQISRVQGRLDGLWDESWRDDEDEKEDGGD